MEAGAVRLLGILLGLVGGAFLLEAYEQIRPRDRRRPPSAGTGMSKRDAAAVSALTCLLMFLIWAWIAPSVIVVSFSHALVPLVLVGLLGMAIRTLWRRRRTDADGRVEPPV